jgi:hypothetical protein
MCDAYVQHQRHRGDLRGRPGREKEKKKEIKAVEEFVVKRRDRLGVHDEG